MGTLEAVLQLVSPRASRALHLLSVGTLAALVVAAPLSRASSASSAAFGIACVTGVVFGAAYARLAPVRSFVSVLSPAPVLFALLFLFAPAIAELRAPVATPRTTAAPAVAPDAPPIVLLVFDELPVTSLMREDLFLDADLFPNFARLGETSTWFRNATTNHERTEYAVPAILSGLVPDDPDRLPTLAHYPRNVFTLLEGGYAMHVDETFTSLAPQPSGSDAAQPESSLQERVAALVDDLAVVYGHVVLPAPLRNQLPDISNAWGGFGDRDTAPAESANADEADQVEAKQNAARTGRSERFLRFVEGIEPSERPTLHFLHMLIPHGPWNRLRSGRKYDPTGLPETWAGRIWPDDLGHTALAFQRHLMHLGHLDGLLGALFARLEERDLFDEALIVVVADHGISFEPGAHGRQMFDDNVRRIAHVPLFVKAPGQTEGRIDDRNAETIDVLPTLLRAAGVELAGLELSGADLLAAAPSRPIKTVHRRLDPLELPPALPARWKELELKTRLFGKKRGWPRMFGLGGPRDRLGARLSDPRSRGQHRARAHRRPRALRVVRPERTDRAHARDRTSACARRPGAARAGRGRGQRRRARNGLHLPAERTERPVRRVDSAGRLSPRAKHRDGPRSRSGRFLDALGDRLTSRGLQCVAARHAR